VRDQFAGVGLLETPLDLGQQEQSLHGIFQGGILREACIA
jgi:hypothetical protein